MVGEKFVYLLWYMCSTVSVCVQMHTAVHMCVFVCVYFSNLVYICVVLLWDKFVIMYRNQFHMKCPVWPSMYMCMYYY